MSQPENNTEVTRLQKENQRLRRALEELSILNEIAVAINSALSLDRILIQRKRGQTRNSTGNQPQSQQIDSHKIPYVNHFVN